MISKQEAKRWIRTVEISDPQKHPQHDFTVYKVKLKYVPVSTMDDEWQIVIYKRYNDFKKLYQTLSTYHKKLQQRDPFPELVKASFFDRNDPTVIESRRESAENVLNFCSQYYHLHTHESFRLFFESGLKSIVQLGMSKEPSSGDHSLTLNPTSAEMMSENCRNEFVDIATPLSPTPFLPQFSRQDSTTTSVSATQDEAPALPPDDDIACLSDLSAALNELEKLNPPPLISNSDDGSLSENEDQAIDDDKAFKEDLFDTSSNQRLSTSELKNSDLEIFDPFKISSYEVFPSSNLEVLSYPQLPKENPNMMPIPDLVYGTSPDEAYIQQASYLVARAQNFEAAHNWSEAFTVYKTAVGILLQGVQEDSNVARRTDVRAKTALYLEKAEYLHRTFIETDDNKDNWIVIDNSVTLTLEASILNMCLPRGHLARFKVLGLSGNIQLVYEKSSGESYALKCIRKCPASSQDVKTIVVPKSPYMVQLHHISETIDCIFLFMEHNTGVLLMDWIKEFTHRESSDYVENSVTLHNAGDSRVYEGRSLLAHHITSEPTIRESNHSVIDSHDDVFNTSVPRVSSSEESLPDKRHADTYAALFNSASVQSTNQMYKRQLSSDSWGSLKSDQMNFTVGRPTLSQGDERETNPTLISQAVPIDSFSIGSFDDEKNENPCQLNGNGDKRGPTLRKLSEQLTNRRSSFNRQLSSTSQSSKHRCKSLSDETRSLDGDVSRDALSDSLNGSAAVLSRSVDSSKPSNRLRNPSRSDQSAANARRWSAVFDHFNERKQFQSESTSTPRIPESCLKQWAAELVTAIDALHRRGIVLRDLHRENVLLGPGGHIRLTFFSQWSHAPPGSTFSSGYRLAESNQFVAPELTDCIYRIGLGQACDWWSLGVLLYELLTSCELSAVHPQGLTAFTRLCLPQWLSEEAVDLLNKLLVINPGERLGCSQLDAEEVKMHPFFSGIDWMAVESNGY